jgi:predicted lipoprotein with Yx(FWY)xxD motif
MFAGPRGAQWVAAASLALLAAARFYGPPYQAPASGSTPAVPLATPPGITLQLRSSAKRVRVATDAEWVYADAHGMSLYTNDRFTSEGAGCTGECAAAWPAALAPASSGAEGGWSLLPRADGSSQWAYRGAPLHRFAGDKAIGDTEGDGAESGVWHAAVFRPADGLALPDGIGVREIADAGGAGLVDLDGMTLYVWHGAAAPVGHGAAAPAELSCASGDCARRWIPLEAPAMANASDEFSAVARTDGITQWTFRNQPLYRFDGDRNPGDVNGSGLDEEVGVALIVRFFMPPDATLHRTLELGNILATRGGATLYQRDRVAAGAELHPFRTDHGSPALGRSLGTAACDASCANAWPPFAAPADALPSGFWDVVTRSDGRRQWAYKGFALYTYTGDKPGEFNGNGIYALDPIGDAATRAASPVPVSAAPGIGIGAMFWHAVVP